MLSVKVLSSVAYFVYVRALLVYLVIVFCIVFIAVCTLVGKNGLCRLPKNKNHMLVQCSQCACSVLLAFFGH